MTRSVFFQAKEKTQQSMQNDLQKISQFNSLFLKLKIIKKLAPNNYKTLEIVFSRQTKKQFATKNETRPATLFNLARLALANDFFQHNVEASYQFIKKIKEEECYALEQTFSREHLKWLSQESEARYAFDLQSPLNFYKKLFAKNNAAQIKADTKKLLNFLAPRLCLNQTYSSKQIIEEPVTSLEELTKQSIDAIFIMGNNDLKQVDNVVMLYRHLAQHTQAPKCIYISGCGGHGTAPGYIFGSTEAEAMAERLIAQGIPAHIIRIEKKATDSVKNIYFTLPLIKKDDETLSIKNILMSGSPSALLRQSRLFEKHADYSWNKLITFPPTPNEIDQLYNATEIDLLINMMCHLREAATFFTLSISYPYMSSRALQDERALTICLQTVVNYYNLFTQHNFNADLLITQYLQLNKGLAMCETDNAIQALQDNFNTHPTTQESALLIKEMSGFFRLCFDAIEREFMQTIRAQMIDRIEPKTKEETLQYKLSLKTQTTLLNAQEQRAKEKSLSQQLNALIDAPFALKPSKHKSRLFTQEIDSPIPINNTIPQFKPGK